MVRGILLKEDLLYKFEILILQNNDVVKGFGEIEEVLACKEGFFLGGFRWGKQCVENSF